MSNSADMKATLAIEKAKMDAVINAANKLGTRNDPLNAVTFTTGRRLTQQEEEDMYRFDWVSRRVVDAIPQDATREGIDITTGDVDQEQEILTAWNESGAMEVIEEADIMARIYGGAVVIVGTDDAADPETPLDPINAGNIKFFNILDRHELNVAARYRDPMAPMFDKPEVYSINTNAAAESIGVKIHETRLLRFDGAWIPPRVARVENDWMDSVYVHLYDSLRNLGLATHSGGQLFQDFVTKVLQLPNLAEMLSDDVGSQMLEKRVQLAITNMSNMSIALVGADETMAKIQTPIQGFDKLLSLYIDIMAGASGIPRSRFFGQQLGVLAGATEQTRSYYDMVNAYQKRKYNGPIKKLLTIMLNSKDGPTGGTEPAKWSFSYNSLWKDDEKTQAETREIMAKADAIYLDRNVLHEDEVRESRFGDERFSLETTLDAAEHAAFTAEEEEEAKRVIEEAEAQAKLAAVPKPVPGAAQ